MNLTIFKAWPGFSFHRNRWPWVLQTHSSLSYLCVLCICRTWKQPNKTTLHELKAQCFCGSCKWSCASAANVSSKDLIISTQPQI